MACELDHLVLGAATLEAGIAYAAAQFGVTVPPGGRHPQMGTHNAVMSLGGMTYFEVIATEPGKPAPAGPRWFGLDNPVIQARLAERPRLLAWVARTDELAVQLAKTGGRFGRPVAFTRDALHWTFGLHETGLNEGAPATPVLIEWPPNVHPAPSLGDLGVRLETLVLSHPRPDWLRAELAALDFADAVTIEQAATPGLSAILRRPDGKTVRMD